MRSRLFSGEVPAPSTLIAVYLVARVSLDALAGLAPHYAGAQSSHAAVKRGALSALVESVCVWGVCHALVKTRVFEPKTLPRPQLQHGQPAPSRLCPRQQGQGRGNRRDHGFAFRD